MKKLITPKEIMEEIERENEYCYHVMRHCFRHNKSYNFAKISQRIHYLKLVYDFLINHALVPLCSRKIITSDMALQEYVIGLLGVAK